MFVVRKNSIRHVTAVVLATVPGLIFGVTRPLAEEAPALLLPSPEVLVEADRLVKMIKLPKGLSISVWAAEPMLQNPVGFGFDEQGRVFVAEGNRRKNVSVLDTRDRHAWPSAEFKKTASPGRMKNIVTEILDGDLAAKTVADRERMLRTYFAGDLERFTGESEVIKRVVDTDGDGRADQATVYADRFNGLVDGVLASVLARKGDVFATSIPSLWRLRDHNNDGVSDDRVALSTGYGVRWAFHGHDLHGLRIGPDGRLYFSLGDRGATVKTKEGTTIANPDTGGIFRCELDGSHMELFYKGLRNPQDLAFDDLGNLFTGDNNSDGGDNARVVYLVEGGDSGWRIGLQNLIEPRMRGPWLEERWSFPPFHGQAAYLVPPVAHLSSGPSGFAHHPGGGPLARYRDHFFLSDFRGQASTSGVWAFRVAQTGAGFRMGKPEQFALGLLATDVDFGPDGALYLLDWVTGWEALGKGRIYRVVPKGTAAAKTKAGSPETVADLLRADLRARAKTNRRAVVALLRHLDARVRQEAQFALADGGDANALAFAARDRAGTPLSRLHALWGLGQIVRRRTPPVDDAYEGLTGALPIAVLRELLSAPEPELRGQSARALADADVDVASGDIAKLLDDRAPRARFFAAIALGKLGAEAARPALVKMIADNADKDPWLRHAGVAALADLHAADPVLELAGHESRAVRLAAVVVLRRLRDPRVARFLHDKDLLVVREAALAINDEPIESATGELAALAEGWPDRSPHLVDDAVLKRVVHANMRLGNEIGARRLAMVSTEARFALPARRDAVTALGDWAAPLPRNRVTGGAQPYMPGARDKAPARAALLTALPSLMAPGEKNADLTSAAAVSAAQLGLKEGSGHLDKVVRARDNDPKVRLSALQTLSELEAPELAALLPVAAEDPDQSVRMTVLQSRVKREPARTVDLALAALNAPSIMEKQTAIGLLAGQKTRAADAAVMGLLDQLLAGTLAPELTLDVLDAAGMRAAKEFKEKLAAFDAKRPKDDLGGFIEVMSGGNLTLGKRIFNYHEQVQCRKCHSVEGQGAMAGPGLQSVGLQRDRKYLLESVLQPSKHFAPGFESVMLTMKSGAVHGGTLKKETPRVLALETVNEGNITLEKKLVAERMQGVSAMPEGFGYILTKRQLRDLIEFLSQQQKKK